MNNNKPFIICCLIIFSALMGCQSHKGREALTLQKVESIMYMHPDSALSWLQNIKNPEKLEESLKAHYALLLVQAQYKNGISVENDSMLQIAYQYYNHSADSLRKAWSCFYLAQVYRDLDLKEKALKYFYEADVAGKAVVDYKFKNLLYYHWGALFNHEALFSEATEKLKTALHYAVLMNDTAKQIVDWRGLGWNYIGTKEYENAYSCLKEGIKLSVLKDKLLLSRLYHDLAVTFHYDNQPLKALHYINLCLKEDFDRTEDLENFYATKGDIFLDLQKYDSARYYYEKIHSYDTYVDKGAYHLCWAKLEEAVGDCCQAFYHRKQYDLYLDTIYQEGLDKQMLKLQRQYDYVSIKQENSELKMKEQRSHIFILAISFTLVVALLFIGIIYTLYSRARRSKEEALRSKESFAKEMEVKLLENSVSLQQMQNEKEMLLVNHHQQQQEMADEIMRNNEILKRIKASSDECLKHPIQNVNMLSEGELGDMVAMTNICFNHFADRLQTEFPKLTASDIHLCCLIRLGIPEQNILYLLDIGKTVLRKRKSRLKCEKLVLQENASLYDFLLAY